MNFFRDVVSHLLKNAFEGHTKFSVADSTAVGDNPIRSITLDAVPVNNDTLISLSWEGGEKLFEKTLSEQEASHQFDLISTDLAEVAALTKQGEYDAAKDLMKKLGQKYAENTGDIVDTNLPKLHNTQASQDIDPVAVDDAKVEIYCYLMDEKHRTKAQIAKFLGSMTDEQIIEWNKKNVPHYDHPRIPHPLDPGFKYPSTEASQDDKLWRKAKITMQNLWFTTTDELLEYQEKQKKANPAAGGDQDHIPLWDKNKGKQAPKDELAPASLSYEDMQNEKERDHEDMQKHIDEKIKTELESALQEKAASVFGPDQVELVKVLRKNGRNWDEIKKILIKDFNFDKDSVNIFVDEQRQGADPMSVEVKPEEEKPEDKKPLTPPEELVSPETHEKLLQDHEDKKKVDPTVEEKEPNFTPKDIMDIPEDDEIEEASSLSNEIARADNDDIHKVAAGNWGECGTCGHDLDKHTKEDFKCNVCHKDCKTKKKAAPNDLNPLQEPIEQKPTTPNTPTQDSLAPKQTGDHLVPQTGDRVFVTTDLNNEKDGFEATFTKTFKDGHGKDWAIVKTDQQDDMQVEMHRVTKISEGSGAQETDPASEPQIEAPKDDQIPVTTKMDDLHSLSSQDSFLAIKKEAEQLLKDVEGMGKTSYMFIRKGLEKHADDSAFEGNGWCRVWIQEDEVATSPKYAEALKLPDENARIDALKEIARELAHEALRLADSAGAKVGVQSWFDSLTPSDHDRIDWVALATPQAAESSLEPKVEKESSDHKDCADKSGTGHAGPIVSINDGEKKYCDKHLPAEIAYNRPAKKASDFEKGISQNKTSAEPEVAPKTQFKDFKRSPDYVDKEKAVPAAPEMGEALSKIEALQSNLNSLAMAREQLEAKLNEELAKIDQQGGRAEIEAELQATIEKTAVLFDALENKVVQWKDNLYTLQTNKTEYLPKMSVNDWLEKFKKRFDEAEKFISDVKNGMLSQVKHVIEKRLIRWPNKKSSINKEADILDELKRYNEELLTALKLLSMPL